MAETLGSLCDKLTIIKLKQFHTEDEMRLSALSVQEKLLTDEINSFVGNAVAGNIPLEVLVFSANKVYKTEGNEIPDITGGIGEVFAELAKVNCDLWHEQEKVYEFEKVPVDQKDTVVKQLALLNLQRTQCINRIDQNFQKIISEKKA